MYKCLKMAAPGYQQRIERCSVLTANSLIKTSRNNFISGSWGHCKELYPEPHIELRWNDANNPGDRLHGQNQVLQRAETIKWEQNVIASYQYYLSWVLKSENKY